jgi:dTDP-4-dehydrorhamnose reductase
MEIIAVGRPELDLVDRGSVFRAVERVRPDLVISAAAYTAVDEAEDHAALAHAVNASGAGWLAQAASECGAPIIHISTDYVFSGNGDAAYVEEDRTGPINVYGRTKLEGEQRVAAANPRCVILRTSWVYSPFGTNFVRSILKAARTRTELNVVSDCRGKPTSALDIADALFHVAENMRDLYGTYHFAGTGETTWAGFARHILQTSRKLGGPFAQVIDTTAANYPSKACRPKDSRLSTRKFEQAFGWRAPAWQESSDHVVERLLAANL